MRFASNPSVRAVLLVAALLLARDAPAVAQSASSGGISAHRAFWLGADEQTLWLGRSEEGRTVFLARGPDGAFTPRPPLNGSIASLAVNRGALYVFLGDGDCYSLRDNAWTPELNLPGRSIPLDLVDTDRGLHALIPASGDDAADAGETPTTGSSSKRLAVARYDPRGWTIVAATPTDLATEPDPRQQPRLGQAQGFLHVVWLDRNHGQFRCERWDAQTSRWVPGPSLSAPPNVSAFWVAPVSRVLTLIAAERAADGTEELRAWRLLGDLQIDSAAWRPGALALSALPADLHPLSYLAAAGFNQHVALLVSTTSGVWLRFGRIDGQPAEPSRALTTVFQQQHGPGPAARWFQTGTLLVLTATLLTLFVFRRGSLAQTLALPAEWTLAFAFQRLAGCLLDLLPFAIGAAALLGVDARSGLRELFAWAVGPDTGARRMPGNETLLWWAVATGSYTLYGLILELLVGRTLAKFLLGTHLRGENGQRPAWHQVVVRNLFRFLELQPPLWILGFLVLLSRNRQRLGDIFARTVVVRRVRTPTSDPPEGE